MGETPNAQALRVWLSRTHAAHTSGKTLYALQVWNFRAAGVEIMRAAGCSLLKCEPSEAVSESQNLRFCPSSLCSAVAFEKKEGTPPGIPSDAASPAYASIPRLKKASQSLRPQAQKILIIFSGSMYVGENTSRLANVRAVRLLARSECAAARRNPLKREPSEAALV